MFDIVWFLPRESFDVHFAKLREKEEILGEVLTLRMQDKKEVTASIEKIQDIQKRTDMQGWQKDGITKLKNWCITFNLIR